MNLYEVFYTYTVPTEDTPFCKVNGSQRVESHSHVDAKKQVSDRLAIWNHENLTIVKSKIIRKNTHRLVRDDGRIKGVGACFTFNGREIAVVADDKSQLQDMLNLINRNTSVTLDESKCVDVNITKNVGSL